MPPRMQLLLRLFIEVFEKKKNLFFLVFSLRPDPYGVVGVLIPCLCTPSLRLLCLAVPLKTKGFRTDFRP